MKKQFALRSLTVATTLAVAVLSSAAVQAAGFTGSAAVVSKYVLRGNTMVPENSGAAVQSSLTYTFDSGLYLGWWGSSLDYTVTNTPKASPGFENDLILGYSLPIGKSTLDFGVVQYYYMGVKESDGIEPYVNFSTGPFTFGLKYLANDVIWGNQGDMYVTAAYKQALPSDFTFNALVGYYHYEDEGDFEKANGVLGTAGLGTTESGGLKHIDLTLTHPLGKTGLDMSVALIIGGDDRSDNDLKNTMVLGISGAF